MLRFRVNIFSQRGKFSIVMRKLNTEIPSLAQLKMPEIFHDVTKEKTGLVLVTGATGSGKSTTLAAMLNEINTNKSVHIITLEDPVEFVHPHKKSTFNQREMGSDFSISPPVCAPLCARPPRWCWSAKCATAKRWKSALAPPKPAIWS